jgi:hypothetical protein
MSSFLAFNANKELGIISGYQETAAGRKSAHTTVFSEPAPATLRVEATFVLAAKVTAPKGAIRDVLCARLALASPSQEQTATPLKTVSLRTSSGDTGVGFAVGEYREAGVPPVLLVFNDFTDARANHRVADRRPVLVVRSAEDPSKGYVLAKCESDSGKNSRSVKLGSARTLLKMAVGGGGKLAPDKDWTVDVTSRAESAGVWIVTPVRDLQPGEYGLWDIDGGGVALFGVD